MNSKVISIADMSGFTVSDDLKDLSIPEALVEERLHTLADNLGSIDELSSYEDGAVLICENISQPRRSVLLYPSLGLPGAEQAESDAKALAEADKVGTTFRTMLCGDSVDLKLIAIRMNRPASLDDSLALKTGFDGVQTLDDLKQHLLKDEIQKKKNGQEKAIVQAAMDYLFANSVCEIDPDESREWALKQATLAFQENLNSGIDLRFTEDGEMLSEEEAIERLADEYEPQFVQKIIVEKICEDEGYEPDFSSLPVIPMDNLPVDGIPMDGVPMDGLSVEGMAMDGIDLTEALPEGMTFGGFEDGIVISQEGPDMPDAGIEMMDPAMEEIMKENDRYLHVMDKMSQIAREVLQ